MNKLKMSKAITNVIEIAFNHSLSDRSIVDKKNQNSIVVTSNQIETIIQNIDEASLLLNRRDIKKVPPVGINVIVGSTTEKPINKNQNSPKSIIQPNANKSKNSKSRPIPQAPTIAPINFTIVLKIESLIII